MLSSADLRGLLDTQKLFFTLFVGIQNRYVLCRPEGEECPKGHGQDEGAA